MTINETYSKIDRLKNGDKSKTTHDLNVHSGILTTAVHAITKAYSYVYTVRGYKIRVPVHIHTFVQYSPELKIINFIYTTVLFHFGNKTACEIV